MAAVVVRGKVSSGAAWILMGPRFSLYPFVPSFHFGGALERDCFYCTHLEEAEGQINFITLV